MINRNSHYRQLEPDIIIGVETIISISGHFLELGYRSKNRRYIISKIKIQHLMTVYFSQVPYIFGEHPVKFRMKIDAADW